MRVSTEGATALVDLEGYEDLLRVRALPDYRFVAPHRVRVGAGDLAGLGLPSDVPAAEIEVAPHLFDYQAWVVARALKRERFAVFMLTGLGKTAVQLEWARLVTASTGGRVLVVAPLNVCHQTIAEAARFYGEALPALFAYSQELGDVANVRGTAADTSEHRLVWGWFAERLLRVMAPGRMVAIHCKEIVQPANIHGHRWCYDYPSELRAGMEDAGFHYHRRITIEKNPQSEATRNKETSLLHVTVRRNALNSFPQTGEYLLVFQAPGEAETPVPVDLSFEDWCRWANSIWPDWDRPTWHGIRETYVLNTAVARATPDERHVCPLQLGLIERVVRLWSNPGELVLSPFAGIGSELYVARHWGRRGYGIELKESYYRTAVANLRRLDQHLAQDLRLVDVDDISPGRHPAPQYRPGAERRSERHTAPQTKATGR